MDRGRFVQSGSPRDLYDHPATRFVAEFLGSPPMSLLPCAFEIFGDSLRIRVVGLEGGPAWTASPRRSGPLRCATRRGSCRPGPAARAPDDRGRPVFAHDRAAGRGPPPGAAGPRDARGVAVGPHVLGLRLPASTPLRAGDRVTVGIDPGRAGLVRCRNWDVVVGMILRGISKEKPVPNGRSPGVSRRRRAKASEPGIEGETPATRRHRPVQDGRTPPPGT